MNARQRRQAARKFIRHAAHKHANKMPADIATRVRGWPPSKKRKLVLGLLLAAESRGATSLAEQVREQTLSGLQLLYVVAHDYRGAPEPVIWRDHLSDEVLAFLLSTPA